MNVAIIRQSAGVYNVVGTGNIVVGHIVRETSPRSGNLTRNWIGYDKHIGTFQGEDGETYPTLAAAKNGAADYYAPRQFCSDGCGTLTCAGETYCPRCLVAFQLLDRLPATVDDTITGTAADALEYGEYPAGLSAALVDITLGVCANCTDPQPLDAAGRCSKCGLVDGAAAPVDDDDIAPVCGSCGCGPCACDRPALHADTIEWTNNQGAPRTTTVYREVPAVDFSDIPFVSVDVPADRICYRCHCKIFAGNYCGHCAAARATEEMERNTMTTRHVLSFSAAFETPIDDKTADAINDGHILSAIDAQLTSLPFGIDDVEMTVYGERNEYVSLQTFVRSRGYADNEQDILDVWYAAMNAVRVPLALSTMQFHDVQLVREPAPAETEDDETERLDAERTLELIESSDHDLRDVARDLIAAGLGADDVRDWSDEQDHDARGDDDYMPLSEPDIRAIEHFMREYAAAPDAAVWSAITRKLDDLLAAYRDTPDYGKSDVANSVWHLYFAATDGLLDYDGVYGAKEFMEQYDAHVLPIIESRD
jgi:hypothetical protein